ncbi:carboxylesterase family protein [Neolewinella aurantiaca]|uniref:Carboxylic ester hydrolase n=1 Tax=Neolewinella aurantiaca TaxID=2602767 RepID=A0A5C7FH55_9BACT|nr:carboxylesterase family protein [Neolewinella aurantiaca]TXF90388.1 carboxylesterase family protein [Neolewinella aurantiaca]
MKTFFLTLAIVAIASALFAQNPNGFPVHTTVQGGILEGDYDNKTGIQTYLGIPYAQPPVGPLRWKAPQPMKPWSGKKMAKNFGPRAIQKHMWDDMLFRSDGLSEDCLYLNVWTPRKQKETGLPVLLYFYGGGHVAGDGSEYRYDGESMAKEGIVVVTVNYRLNLFGYFAHPELSKEAPYSASGNYGALDQSASLQWVKDNIAAFGGDPDHITIAGESAGSMSTSLHMASPLSRDNIAGAIGESGALINPTGTPVPLKEAEQTGAAFVAQTGYSWDEFRKLSTAELFELYNEYRPQLPMVLDGYLLPKTLPAIFEAREQAMVPLLLGWNSAELPAAAFLRPPFTRAGFEEIVKQRISESSDEALKLYAGQSGTELEQTISDFGSDNWIVFSTWKWFDLHRKNSNQPVYRYLYSKLRPANAAGERPAAIGAPHACEIEYALGNLHLVPGWQWTEDDYKVSSTMKSYFANFIKTGDPNGEDLPGWPKVAPGDDSPPVMVIDVESKAVPAKNDARYRFLNRMYHGEQ